MKTFLGFSIGRSLTLGSEIPGVTSVDQDGNHIDFRKYLRSGYGLVFFFPKAETPGCIAQACSLRDAFDELQERGVRVVGVSSGSVSSLKRFHENRSLMYPLISDSSAKVADAFGVPRIFGICKRQCFLFGDGELRWKDTAASTSSQANDVIDFLKQAGPR